MNEREHITLLLVDDHELVRIGLKGLFEKNPYFQVVGEADDVNSAMSEALRLQPAVVLMDLRLPSGSGIEACRYIVENCPQTKILFLTSYSEEDSILAAVIAGAHGYLLKEIGSEALAQAVTLVAAGQTIMDRTAARRVFQWLSDVTRQPSLTTTPSPSLIPETLLSPQEHKVIALVASGKTNKEIGTSLGLSDKTVRNYLSNIFEKLRITRRAQAAAFFVQQQIKKG